MDFYDIPSPGTAAGLIQGDILAPVPFLAISITEAIALTPDVDAPIRLDLTTVSDLPPRSQLFANVVLGVGIVLSQSCDLRGTPGRERPILIARVAPAVERIKDFRTDSDLKRVVSQIRSLANPGKAPSLFYLPEAECGEFHLPRSVADLLEVSHLPPSNLTSLRQILKLRLSQPALQAFQERLAYCLGRYGAPDHLYFNPEEADFANR